MDEKNRGLHVLLLIAAILVAVAIGAYYYSKVMTNQHQRQYNAARTDMFSGNYDVAAEKFKALVTSAPDKKSEGLNKIFLADSLYRRNENDDILRAMDIYKSIVNDYKIPPSVRASALNGIASIVDSNSVSFYKLHFAEAPYSAFLPETGTERSRISKAYLAILKLSDETFPSSNAEYTIANYYASHAAGDSLEDGMTAKEAAEIMLKYVSDGDSLKDDSRFADSVNITRYLNRAVALNIAGKILGTDVTAREAGFKLALEKAAPYEASSDQFARAEVMRLRFFYANFLMVNLGERRFDDIKDLLMPFNTAATSSEIWAKNTRRYFINIMDLRSGGVLNKRAIDLGKVSPEFRVFVESAGIK